MSFDIFTSGLLVEFHAGREIPRMRTPYGDTPPNANNNIRAVRKAKGLTLEEVASRLKTTPQSVQRWEVEGNLSVKKLHAVADALGVTPAELVPGSPALSDRQKAILALFDRIPARDQDTLEVIGRTLAERGEQTPFEVRKEKRAS